MDRIELFRQWIREIISSHAAADPYSPEVECQLVFDSERDRYLLLDVGWKELTRIYRCFIQIDIKDGKIWIQRNMTEADLAQELLDRGVQKDEIVLGLHPPYKRPYTGYAIA